MKKAIFLVTGLLCTVLLFAGGGSQSKQGDSGLYVIQTLGEPIAGLKRSDDTKVGQYIRDKFGIVFEYSPFSGDVREKQSLMLAAGDYGEVQPLQRDDMVLNYINAGALIDLLPYLDSIPNFKSRYKDLIPYWRLICGGPLYKYENWVPRNLNTDIEVNDILVRSDLLEKAGWPQLLSTSDWIAFLEKVVPGAVDVNGRQIAGLTMSMAEPWGLAGVVCALYEKGGNYLPLSNEGFIFDFTNDRFVDYFQNENVKESFKFLSDLNRRGLLDPECFSDFYAQTTQKIYTGSVAAVNYSIYSGGANELRNAGHPEMEYVKLPIQSDSQVRNGEKRLVRMETTRSFNSFGLTKNCKNPEKLLALIDWACTDEGQIMLTSGIEGVHWTRNSSGKRVWTDFLVQMSRDSKLNLTEGLDIWTDSGLPRFNLPAADGQPHNLKSQIEWVDGQGQTDRAREVYTKLGWDSSMSWYSKNTKLGHTGVAGTVYVDPTSDLGAVHTKMTETRIKHSASLIMAKTDAEFESAYRNAMAEYDRLDHKAVIDEFNRQYREKIAGLNKYR
ncbi:MAG: hypothetical protein LBS48_03805 [Treponema sp.]|nr:hypothetical protein [Treponema sp.]